MSLHSIVAALGGDLYHGGRRASVPAPGHSSADRSISLVLSEGRVVAHGFGAADWREALDDLQRRGLIDSERRPRDDGTVGPSSPLPSRPERVATARALWAEASPISPRSPAAVYARARSIPEGLVSSQALRLHPHAPLSVYRPTRQTRPALVAAVRDRDGALSAVELTYLNPNGRLATDLRLPRKTVGLLPAGCAVRLSEAGPEMVVGEGVFTTLSAIDRFGLPGWALLSANRMACWTPPPGVRSILIAGDPGVAGERAAARLAANLRTLGIAVETRLPPIPFSDWNAWAMGRESKGQSKGAEECRDGGDGPRSARLEPAPCPILL